VTETLKSGKKAMAERFTDLIEEHRNYGWHGPVMVGLKIARGSMWCVEFEDDRLFSAWQFSFF
jgi:hypothetical protein